MILLLLCLLLRALLQHRRYATTTPMIYLNDHAALFLSPPATLFLIVIAVGHTHGHI